MKDKPNEWVSIADLMSGVMAIVMLLLVMAVLQKTFAEIQHKQREKELMSHQQQYANELSTLLTDFQKQVKAQGLENTVSFDIQDFKITLKDNTFEKGSACITSETAKVFKGIDQQIAHFLSITPNATIYVEGHTDNLAVTRPITDYTKFCTVYDDNYTLSAARAREARKLLISHLNETQARKIIVAGFGDSRPLPNTNPSNGKNRRVEIKFIP